MKAVNGGESGAGIPSRGEGEAFLAATRLLVGVGEFGADELGVGVEFAEGGLVGGEEGEVGAGGVGAEVLAGGGEVVEAGVAFQTETVFDDDEGALLVVEG